jgi:hypothetical protein
VKNQLSTSLFLSYEERLKQPNTIIWCTVIPIA